MSKIRLKYRFEPALEDHLDLGCRDQDMERRRWSVYECYTADGHLLYVGHSGRVILRLAEHSKTAPWFPELGSVLIRLTACKKEATRLESQLIHSQLPLYNVPMRAAGRRGAETRYGRMPPVHVERGTFIGHNPALIPRGTRTDRDPL